MPNKIIQGFLHLYFLLIRPLTIGVRGLCYDASSNSILLVRNTFSNDWSLPGGGVGKGEPIETALQRELREETGLISNDFKFIDIYFNKSISRRDHVIIFQVRSWAKKQIHNRPIYEIADCNWYSLDMLPDNLTPCTMHLLKIFFKIK